MWDFQSRPIDELRASHFYAFFDSRPASFTQVLEAWQNDSTFRTLYSTLLAHISFSAFRWETPPVTAATIGRQFEFVVLDTPSLSQAPDPSAFMRFLVEPVEQGVVTFLNLGGDAMLVVPCQMADPSAYGHLAAFVRGAPEQQRDALWKAVAGAMFKRLGERPVWLSTAGAGVPWLHVRLDDRPKYYGFAPFRSGTY